MINPLHSGQSHIQAGDSAEEFMSIHAVGRERLPALSLDLWLNLLKILCFARCRTMESFCLRFLRTSRQR